MQFKRQTVVPVFVTLTYNQKSTLKAQNGTDSSIFLHLLSKLHDIVTQVQSNGDDGRPGGCISGVTSCYWAQEGCSDWF